MNRDELSFTPSLRELAQRTVQQNGYNQYSPRDFLTEQLMSANLEKLLQTYQKGGNVNLLDRPRVSGDDMRNAGYSDFGGDFATVYTHGFSNQDNTKYRNFTPILSDGSILSPEEFQSYVDDVLSGRSDDYLNLQIGKEFDNQKDADIAAEKIHELQEMYYDNRR